MTDLPDVRIKTLTNFPSNALGGIGVEIAKVDGNYIIDIAYSEVAQVVLVPAETFATTFVMLWEETQNTYQRISLPDLKIALGIV